MSLPEDEEDGVTDVNFLRDRIVEAVNPIKETAETEAFKQAYRDAAEELGVSLDADDGDIEDANDQD